MKKEQLSEAHGKHVANIVDYQSTFDTPHGKRVLRHLMKVHGFMQTSYVEKDAYAMAFNEGARNVVIHILKKLRVDVRKLEAEILKDIKGEDDVFI